MSEGNVEIVRRFYAAGARNDAAALSDLLDPQIEVHDSVEVPDAGIYRGIQGFLASLARFRDAWSEDARHEPTELIEAGNDQVLAVVHSIGRGRESEVPVEATWAQIFTIREGKIVLLRSFLRAQEAREAAGLGE